MALLKPFTGLRPAAGRAGEVLAPPYDVLNSAEARQQADGKPHSFLHVSKPEIDLPADADPYAEAVYAQGAANLSALQDSGVLRRDATPCFYVYQLEMQGRVQTGVVAAASVAGYDAGDIRRHEFTRPDKENDRVRHIETLDAQTGPVFLIYRSEARLNALLAEAASGPADAEAELQGVRHSLWVVQQPEQVAAFEAAIGDLDRLYVADGHHRSAAASRVAASRPGDPAAQWFLTVTFPHDQVHILDYNRVLADLHGRTPQQFLDALRERASVTPADAPVAPDQRHVYGLYVDGGWYRVQVPDSAVPADPVGRLAVSVLHDHLIEPVLDISDPRRDPRIDFVGGIRGLGELERRVDSGEMAAAFSLHPTSLEDLMAVADSGAVMPPKSTWFEPKLADGMVTYLLR